MQLIFQHLFPLLFFPGVFCRIRHHVVQDLQLSLSEAEVKELPYSDHYHQLQRYRNKHNSQNIFTHHHTTSWGTETNILNQDSHNQISSTSKIFFVVNTSRNQLQCLPQTPQKSWSHLSHLALQPLSVQIKRHVFI